MTNTEVTLSDQAIYFSQLNGIDLTREILELIKQVKNKDYVNLKKLKIVKSRPLFRKRTPHNTRMLFDYGSSDNHNLWIRVWRVAPRGTVYRNIADESFEKIFGCTLAEAFDTDAEEDIDDGEQYVEQEEFDGIRFYSLTRDDYLSSAQKFQNFVNEKYQYSIKVTPEQRNFIEDLLTSPDRIHRIQGAAGSGKTTCATEYALRLYQEEEFPILLLVPNSELLGWCISLFSNKEPGSVYTPKSEEITIESIEDALRSQIVVLTFEQFYLIFSTQLKLTEQSFTVLENAASFKLTEQSFKELRNDDVPDEVLKNLSFIENTEFGNERDFLSAVDQQFRKNRPIAAEHKELVLRYAMHKHIPDDVLFRIKSLKNRIFIDKQDFMNTVKDCIGEEQAVLYTPIILKHIKFLKEGISKIHNEEIQKLIAEKVVCFRAKLKNESVQKIHQVILAYFKNDSQKKGRDNLFKDNENTYNLVEKEFLQADKIKDSLLKDNEENYAKILLKPYNDLLLDKKTGHKLYYDRIDIVNILQKRLQKNELSKSLYGINLIIDEVQDMNSKEWQLFIDMLYIDSTKDSKLVLLGDINQRVTITDFVWERITEYTHKKYGDTLSDSYRELYYNYRSTKQICALSSYFIGNLYKNSYKQRKTRELPTVADADRCEYVGDKPYLIVTDIDAIFSGIEDYYTNLTKTSGLDLDLGDWIWRWVMIADEQSWNDVTIPQSVQEKILPFTATESKGMEFDTVILYNAIPRDIVNQDIIDITRLYTAITRTRQNLILLFDNEHYNILKSQGFNYIGVHLKEHPDQQEIANILDRVGMNRITEQQLVKAIRELINNFGKTYSDEKVALILSHIQFLFRRSVLVENVESLVRSLLATVQQLFPYLDRFLDQFSLKLEKYDHGIQAIILREFQQMLPSVVQWNHSSFPLAYEQAVMTIDSLEKNTDAFEVLRSSSLINYTNKLEFLKKKQKGIPSDIFNALVHTSQTDYLSTNHDILLSAIQNRVKTVLSSTEYFEKLLG